MNKAEEWINKNGVLLSKYKCKYVAISDRIIASGDHIAEVDKNARKKAREYVLYYVPKTINKVKILPIHVKSISIHEWQPFYQIELVSINNEIFKEEALIDSGADISCFPHQLGVDLEFCKYPQEIPLTAFGIGGEVEYLQRKCEITIDDHRLTIPVAWIQDKGEMELIIGRAEVFDLFDITFSQAEEKIEFHYRNTGDKGKV